MIFFVGSDIVSD